jgi:hypothetical protein
MNKTKSGNNNRPRRSVSFLTRLRPDNLVPNKRPQQQQQGDPLEWPDTKSVLGLENEQPPTKSNSLRRDSLGNIQHFLRTLAYWKRHRSAQPSTDSTQSTTVSSVGVSCNKSEKQPRPVERSKSFGIKCDKGYATYYQIEPKKKHAESDTSSLLLLPEQKTSRNITNNNNNNNNNNRCNPFSNFHEVGLPLPPPVLQRFAPSGTRINTHTSELIQKLFGSGRHPIVLFYIKTDVLVIKIVLESVNMKIRKASIYHKLSGKRIFKRSGDVCCLALQA